MSKRFSGHTATDLAVLLGILGILAALAYPRYEALRAETRKALVRSLGSNVQVSAQVAHLTWIIQNEPPTIEYNDQVIDMLNGYPDAASIAATLANFVGFEHLVGAAANFRKIDAREPDACKVSYAHDSADSSPLIDILTSGC